MSTQERQPVRYEAPRRACVSVGPGCISVIGILVMVVTALLAFDRVTMPECYDDAGTYDDSCSQGYLRAAKKEKAQWGTP